MIACSKKQVDELFHSNYLLLEISLESERNQKVKFYFMFFRKQLHIE